ncbi:MAG TPA: ester cyclase [Ktedonobacterales bacterium]|nr:ester cyclase [Ktedonobacterales bacterium]
MQKAGRESLEKHIDDLKVLAIRWMQDVWQNGDVEAADFLHAPNFLDHSPGEYSPDNEGFKASVRALHKGFPDLSALHSDLIIDPIADKVVVRWVAMGTHRGPFMGAAATEKQVLFGGIDILRIEHGRIIERWREWDHIGLLEQLGLR